MANRQPLGSSVLRFLTKPFTALSATLAPAAPASSSPPSTPSAASSDALLRPSGSQSPNQTLAHFFSLKGDAPLTEHEARGVMALLQESTTPDASLAEEEKENQEDDEEKDASILPSAFTPNFRSLTRRPAFPARPPQASSALLFPPVPAKPHAAPRRTFYMGPGHSVYNHSTRLSQARRNRLAGTGRTFNMLSAAYDPSSQTGLLQKPADLTRNDRQPESTKRRKMTAGPEPLAITQPSDLASLPSAVKLVKTTSATPLRPSPLRIVTSGTLTPSPPRRHPAAPETSAPASTSKPKRMRSSMASSLIKTAVQQVDASLLRKHTPAPASPVVKKADIINPYAELERPRRNTQPKRKAQDIDEETDRERKRKVGIHTGRAGVLDKPKVLVPVEMGAEEWLERTMPDEYRQDQQGQAQRRKKKQVGKLPDRLIKKQQALESKKRRAAGLLPHSVASPNIQDASSAAPAQSNQAQLAISSSSFCNTQGSTNAGNHKSSSGLADPTTAGLFSQGSGFAFGIGSSSSTENNPPRNPTCKSNKLAERAEAHQLEDDSVEVSLVKEEVIKLPASDLPVYDHQQLVGSTLANNCTTNDHEAEEVKQVILGLGIDELPKFEFALNFLPKLDA